MRSSLFTVLVLTVVPALAACSGTPKPPLATPKAPSTSAPAAKPAAQSARAPATVALLEGADVESKMTSVGVVNANGSAETKSSALESLRAKAAGLDADAVVKVEFHPKDSQSQAHYSGVAVRFNKTPAYSYKRKPASSDAK